MNQCYDSYLGLVKIDMSFCEHYIDDQFITFLTLQYLCRGGNEAVQATFELDVVVSDQTEDSTGLTGDLQRGGSVRPVSTQHKTCGKLHLRIANIGHPVDNRKAAGEC